jgi:sterol desaturase/sphingolipid hydroxylase (fatty acid hydroxylase superfamily)
MKLKEQLFRFRSFWIFPLLAVLLLYTTFSGETPTRWIDLVWLFPLGLLLWSLLEYGLHRFVFHIHFNVGNPRLREVLNASHLSHHAAPRDPGKLLVDPLYGFAISTILFGLLFLVFGDAARTVGTLVGIWAGFLYYEVVHYRVHMAASASGLLAWQRRAHFYHHFSNRDRCFGVTTPLWDYVFRTELPRPRR